MKNKKLVTKDALAWNEAPDWFRLSVEAMEEDCPWLASKDIVAKEEEDSDEIGFDVLDLLVLSSDERKGSMDSSARTLRVELDGTQALAISDTLATSALAWSKKIFGEDGKGNEMAKHCIKVISMCSRVEEGKRRAIVPALHLAIHKRGTRANAELKTSGGWFGSRASLVAARDIEEGEEISLDWDDDEELGDSRIFSERGQLDVEASCGTFEIGLSIPADDPFLDDKLDVLYVAGFEGETATFVIQEGRTPSEDLRTMLRLVHLGGTDAFLLEALFREQAWDLISQPVSRENEEMACGSIVQALQQALDSYPTTLEEDFAMLTRGQVQIGSAMEVAVRLRLGEKQALQTGIRFFKGILEQLDDFEYYQERRLKSLGLLNDDGASTFEDFFR